MRNFTWNYFSMTGDIDAYLFYKQLNATNEEEDDFEDESDPLREQEMH